MPRKISKYALVFFATSLIITSFPPYASSNNIDRLLSMSIEELMEVEVVTASKSIEKLIDAPSTIIVVTKQQISERGYVNLLDLLQDLPGIGVYRNNGEEDKSLITVRGNQGNNKFIILMDGVKISTATNEKIPIEDNFPLYLAKQVEVIYGPASALYGADAFTGVVNIITEGTEELDGFTVSATVGTDGYTYGYFKGGAQIADNIKLVIGGHYHRSDNPDLAEKYPDDYIWGDKVKFGTVVIPANLTTDSFSAKTSSHNVHLGLEIANNFELGFRQSLYIHQTDNGVQPSTAVFGDAPWQTMLRTFYGKYRFAIADKISGETTLAYNTYEVLPASGYNNLFVDFQRTYKYARDSMFKFEQQLNYKINAEQRITLGFSFEDYYALPKTADLTKPYDPNTPSADQNFFYIGTDDTLPLEIYEVKYQNTAVYLQLQSSWHEKISSTLGARLDENTRYGNSLNPRAGLVLKPMEPTTIKLLYGESFLAPSPKITYSPFGSFDGDPDSDGVYEAGFFHLPNPDLKPEKARYWELNITQIITSNLILTATGFHNTVDDIIFPEYLTNVPFEGNTNYMISTAEINVNQGKATIYGGDMRIDYAHLLSGGSGLKFWASYSIVDGTIDQGDGTKLELPYIAPTKIKGGITYRYGKFTFTPRIHVISESTHNAIDANDSTKRQKVDGYTLVHFTARGNSLYKNLSVILDIRNLFDAKYHSPGGASGPTAAFIAAPQDTRRITLGLEYKL